MEPQRFPNRVKLPPAASDFVITLAVPKAKNTVNFMLGASADSRALKVTFSGEDAVGEEFTGQALTARGPKGESLSHYIQDFGVYGQDKTFELQTPEKNATLVIKRAGNGDLTVSVKGQDISKSQDMPGPKPYITIHRIEGKTVGYTVKDFLERVNQSFAHLVVQIQL